METLPDDELEAMAADTAELIGGSIDEVNMDAIRLHEAAVLVMERPSLCPFCSMLWDQAEAERIIAARDMAGYAEWLAETAALPVNRPGDELGQRGRGSTS